MEENFDRNIGFLVHDVARLMRTLYDRRMAPLGLTRSQWWVLTFLYAYEGTSQSELAARLDIEKASLGRLLQRMENKGWIVRRDDEKDGRTKRVHLTDKVRPMLQVMRDLASEMRNDAVRSLDEAERDMLTDLLGRMRDDLSLLAANGNGGAAR